MTPIQQPTTSRGARLVEFLGLRRSLVGLLSMVVLVGMGEHMAEQFLPLYLLTLGGGFISVGFLNGMDNLLGALYSFPGGYLSDRLGTKRALLVFNNATMIGWVPRGRRYWAARRSSCRGRRSPCPRR
jgi:MFS family permease